MIKNCQPILPCYHGHGNTTKTLIMLKIILFGSSISSIGSISSSFLLKFPGFEDGVRVDLIIGFIVAILFLVSPNFKQKSSHNHYVNANLSLFRAPLIRASFSHAEMNNCFRDIAVSTFGQNILRVDVALVTVTVLRYYV